MSHMVVDTCEQTRQQSTTYSHCRRGRCRLSDDVWHLNSMTVTTHRYLRSVSRLKTPGRIVRNRFLLSFSHCSDARPSNTPRRRLRSRLLFRNLHHMYSSTPGPINQPQHSTYCSSIQNYQSLQQPQ